MTLYALTSHFAMPTDADWDALRQIAQDRATTIYRNLPGLRAKAFVIDPARRVYGGHYIWESREALDAFLASPIFESSVAKFGQPEVHIYEIAAYVEQEVPAAVLS